MPNNLYIQLSKSFSKYFLNNRSQSRPLNSLNPNPVDSKYASNSEESVYKLIFKPELYYETESERTSLIPIIQNLIYNPYVFRAAMLFLYISKAPSFIGINIIKFFKRFEDMAINYGISDDRKIQRV